MSQVEVHRASEIASTRSGLITAAELEVAGVSRGALRVMVQRGLLEVVGRGAYRFAGGRHDGRATAELALLLAGPGAALARRDAAVLLGITRGELEAPHEITVVSGQMPRAVRRLAYVFRSRRFRPDEDIVLVDGLRVTRAERWVYEVVSRSRGRNAPYRVSEAIVKAGATAASIREQADHVGNLNGRRAVLDAVELLVPGVERVRSVPEAALLALCVSAGLPPPIAAFRITLPDGRVVEADAAYPDRRLWIEVDGAEYHEGLAVTEADANRQNGIILAGFRILRYPARAVLRNPEWVGRQIVAAYDAG